MLKSNRILTVFLSVNLAFSTLAAGQIIVDQNPWSFECQREALAPLWFVDSAEMFEENPTLVLAGNGNYSANGHWSKFVDVVPMDFYRFQVYYYTQNVEEENKSILARILWFDKEGKQVLTAEYPALSENKKEKWNLIEEVYQVSEGAVKAKVELVYRWDADGEVHFGGFSFERTVDPGPRIVRLSTIHHKPKNSSGAMENLQNFASFIDMAAAQNADIVCLPEALTMAGTGSDYVSAAESIPGPTTKFLSEIALKYQMYIVAGILEMDDETVYNTAILIDRNGELAGKYRKVSLPREEIEGGITPGDSFPVFETDFGRIGMMICWDVSFPDAARALASQGAEVIFMPIAGGFLTLAKARALENQVYLVSSSYDMESAVFDQGGEILAEADDENPVVVVEIDLNQKKYWPWLGDFKNRIPREMPSKKSLNLE